MAPQLLRCTLLLAFLQAARAAIAAQSKEDTVRIYFANGCFWVRQHLFTETFEKGILGRSDAEITSIAGYGGSSHKGKDGTVCYHNQDNISDYSALGYAEVVQVEVPVSALEAAFSTYFKSFIEESKGIWTREDYFDVGAEYRATVGFPGGLKNAQVVAAMHKANLHNMSLHAGLGSDNDTFGTNGIFVVDSHSFPFVQAELCLQFDNQQGGTYPASYHALRNISEQHGRLSHTGCPRQNFVCNSTAQRARETPTQPAATPAKPWWYGQGKGRKCPAWPKTAKDCPLKNISDVYHEFEPVCVIHFPQIGGQLAELQKRRCMPGEKAPYFKDSQGVFRCSCCGAPLWKPSQQFDELPATQWPWPSFHSPPLNNTDNLPSVCHRGPGTPGVVNRNATVDLGLGVKGEVGCAKCGAHLGDYFDTKDLGMDHYCINGVCMSPPGGVPGEVCQRTVPDEAILI